MVVDKSGSLAGVRRHDHLPFGEELYAARSAGLGYGVTDNVRQKFTCKEKDSETALDYFGVRYYSGSQGRFEAADPLHMEMSGASLTGRLSKALAAAGS